MKATEQYFPVVRFIMLYKVGLTFKSVNIILQCDQSKSYSVILPRWYCFFNIFLQKEIGIFLQSFF